MQQERIESYTGFTNDVKSLYGYGVAVYGPYLRNSDNRAFVLIRTEDKEKQITKLYAKVMLEIKEGRILGKDETVDHIDGDPLNDSFDNLALMSKSANSAKSAKRRIPENVLCVWCSTSFLPSKDQIKNKESGKAGPFCSRTCSGQYGKSVQETGNKLPSNSTVVKYIQNGVITYR